MPEHYFAIGATLAAMVNIETLISTPPTVLLEYGGAPMPLMGSTGRRALSGRLRRDGYAIGAWGFPVMDDGVDELTDLTLALTGALTTASRARYVSTMDTSGHYSPFLVTVDAPYVGETADITLHEHVRAVRVPLVGGVLQSATKAGNYTQTTSDRLLYVDTSGGSRTITLFAVASAALNTVYSFVKTSASNSLILDGNSSETIDAATTKTVTALNARVDLITTNGTTWVSI